MRCQQEQQSRAPLDKASGPWRAQVFHEPMSAKVLVERMELVRHLVDEAQRIAPDRITFHWSCPCQVLSLLP